MLIHPASPLIFVSSVVSEFEDMRSALDYVLTQQGYRVQLSESAQFFVRGDRDAMNECFENIRGCDIFVLIVGNRRGTLYDEKERISVTRQEYRVAKDQFVRSGKPRMLMFLKRTADREAGNSASPSSNGQNEDVEHLRDFVSEIQKDSASSFLRRFGDFSELATGLATSLNLGRNLQETIYRRSVVVELSGNLSHLSHRHENGAIPDHWYLECLDKKLSLSVDDSGRMVSLNKRHADLLAMGTLELLRIRRLRIRASEDALDGGVFLAFQPSQGTLAESSLHTALSELVEQVNQFDSLPAQDWNELMTKHLADTRYGANVPGYLLAIALSHGRRLKNIFDSHVAVTKAILEGTAEVPSVPATATTPFGPREQQKIDAERVSRSDIIHLMESDIWPFGSRQLATVFGDTREEQVSGAMEYVKKATERTANSLDEDSIRKIAESLLEQFAGDDEGLPGQKGASN